ncbi:MAG: hypothetical protein FWJ34_12575 [Geminocystis sp. GBBB08]|nr:hypothetical protein [Geminocystis sp. GBBB08]
MIKKINQLWVDYSQGRFGLSIQQSIWENLGGELKRTEIDSINNKNNIWEKFIEQVGMLPK